MLRSGKAWACVVLAVGLLVTAPGLHPPAQGESLRERFKAFKDKHSSGEKKPAAKDADTKASGTASDTASDKPAPAAGPAGKEPPQDWVGTWVSIDSTRHFEFSFTAVDEKGLHYALDEGVGQDGTNQKGIVPLDGDRAHSSSGCEFTLLLHRAADPTQRRIDVTFPESCFQSSRTGQTTLAPKGSPRYLQAGFDCAKAGTAIEKQICGDRDLADSDRALAQEYGELQKRLDATQARAVRDSQRAWLSERNRRCAGAKDSTCLLGQYGLRRMELDVFPATIRDGHQNLDPMALRRVMLDKRGHIPSGAQEYFATYFAGLNVGSVIAMDYRFMDHALDFQVFGCSNPDPSQGWDPVRYNCGEAIFIELLANGEQWLAFADRHQRNLTIFVPASAPPEPTIPPGVKMLRNELSKEDGPYTEKWLRR
jgi:uncharacterized protein YecT (DUF1311 family)